MIICLRLKNFYSLRDDAVLDFTADDSSRNPLSHLPENLIDYKGDKFVNIIGLFGSNAAGKSNMIKALVFCRNLILNSHLNNEGDFFDFSPFKFGKDEPSEFYIDFVTDGVEYEYSFSVFGGKVTEESLFYYPKGRKAKVFSRAGNKYTHRPGLINRVGEVEANTGDKTLFLSRASSMNRPLAQTVYRFFLNEMLISTGEMKTTGISYEELERNRRLILKAFEVSDSDITDVRVVEDVPGQRRLESFHREDPHIPFDFDKEESEGTKRLLNIVLMIARKAADGATFLFDEFDLKLHLRLSEFLLDLIRATRRGQLVFTSHNPDLINQEKLRREQIVFVNKRSDGSSEFTPLSDYKGITSVTDARKAYLQGRFDAVPYIGDADSVLENLFSAQ